MHFLQSGKIVLDGDLPIDTKLRESIPMNECNEKESSDSN